MFSIGFRYRLMVASLTNVNFLISICAALHLIIMAEMYRDYVASNSDALYLAMTGLCYFGLLAGFAIAQRIFKALGFGSKPKKALQSGTFLTYLSITILIIYAIANMVQYVQTIGSFNPLAGVQHYFTSGNIANETWNNEGAEMYGAARGTASAAGQGDLEAFIAHMLVRIQPVLLLLVGLLGKRLRLWAIVILTGSEMLKMTSGYFARTGLVLTLGLVVLYIHEHIRPFRRREIAGFMLAMLFVFLILNQARLGDAEHLDSLVGKGAWQQYESAISGTFSPIGWAIEYHDSIGCNNLEANMRYFGSYFGAFVPRVLWPSKPYYSLEPDMTMQLTGEDISGNNPVQTFSIIGEGFLVAGLPGVLLMSLFFSLVASLACDLLATRDEFCFVRYYTILFAAISFRLSLFTFFANGIILGLVPVLIIYFFLRPTLVNLRNAAKRHSDN